MDQHFRAGVTQGASQFSGSEPTVKDGSHRPQTVSGQVTDGELRGIEQLESKGVPGTDPVLRKHNGEPFDVSGQLTVGPGAIGCRVDHGKRIAESV